MTKKLMPDLPIHQVTSDTAATSDALGIDIKQVPLAAEDIARVILSRKLKMRTALSSISQVLGWLAYESEKEGYPPEEFMKDFGKMGLRYCQQFELVEKDS